MCSTSPAARECCSRTISAAASGASRASTYRRKWQRSPREIPADKVRVICGDVETARFDRTFDVVMVYNAFPHFPEPERLIASLAAVTKPGGRLSVAHGMSREKLDRHHSGTARPVSNGLISADELAAIFAPFFDVDVKISDDRMYQVSGIRK